MAQTIATLLAPANSSQFYNNIDEQKRKALTVFAKVCLLHAGGGSQYTTNLKQLLIDADAIMRAYVPMQVQAAKIKIWIQSPVSVGSPAQASTDVNKLMALITPLLQLDLFELEKLETYLEAAYIITSLAPG